MKTMRRRQRGFLMIIGIFLLVVIGGLAVYLATVSTASQASSAADVSAARAYQAARAGAEWAAYWITPAPPAKPSTFKTQCDTSPGYTAVGTLTLGDFTVTVTCTSRAPFTEGGGTVQWYSVVSNACNAPTAGACPNNATTSSTYVNREVSLTLTN
jgi:MSHA biogenesis protein MshP